MTAIRTNQPGTTYFDPATPVGAPAEYVSTGPTWVTHSTGTYLGVRMDDEVGEAYHYFDGGTIGDTPQRGMHGFPASHLTPHAYPDRRAYLHTALDGETDVRTLVVTVVDHDSDLQNLTEDVHVMDVTPAGERGTDLALLLADVDRILRGLGWPRFGRWEVGVGPTFGLFAEARVAEEAPRRR